MVKVRRRAARPNNWCQPKATKTVERSIPTHRLHEAITGSRLTVMPGQQHVAMDTAPNLFLTEVLR